MVSIFTKFAEHSRVTKLQRQVESVEERRNQRLLEMHRRRVAMEANRESREKSLNTVRILTCKCDYVFRKLHKPMNVISAVQLL